jgi:hypothetical protein
METRRRLRRVSSEGKRMPEETTLNALTVTTFDYGQLPATDRELAQRAAARFREHQRRTVADALAIGADLVAVKAAIGHGEFGEWLALDFGKSARTAQRYMRAAEERSSKYDKLSDLTEETAEPLPRTSKCKP